MSEIYPTFKTRLLDWAFNGAPSELSWRLALVGSGFNYNPAHQNLGALSDVLVSDFALENPSYLLGRIRADDVALTELEVGDTITGIVIYWKFDGGTQLVCVITDSENEPLPLTLYGEELYIRWADEGVVQL